MWSMWSSKLHLNLIYKGKGFTSIYHLAHLMLSHHSTALTNWILHPRVIRISLKFHQVKRAKQAHCLSLPHNPVHLVSTCSCKNIPLLVSYDFNMQDQLIKNLPAGIETQQSMWLHLITSFQLVSSGFSFNTQMIPVLCISCHFCFPVVFPLPKGRKLWIEQSVRIDYIVSNYPLIGLKLRYWMLIG